MPLRLKLTIWMCMFSPFGLIFCLLVVTLFSYLSPRPSHRLDECRDEELLQVCLHLSNELRSPSVILHFVPQPVGFYEGWQVLRSEVPDLPGVGVPSFEEIHATLLCQVPIQKALHDVFSLDRVETPAFLR